MWNTERGTIESDITEHEVCIYLEVVNLQW